MPAERKNQQRILNVLPSEDTEDDWRFEHSVEAGVVEAPASIPTSLDLREDWWKIGNQLSTGSCVGWALADSVLRWHFVQSGEISKNLFLSPRFIWMASKETDEFDDRPTTFIERAGTSLKAALDVARKYGAVPDAALPFDSSKLSQEEPKTFYALAAKLKIASYFNLGDNLTNWKRWLATQGPILTRLDVDVTWDNAEDTDGELLTYYPETGRGGHAVALVGYTSKTFIVRNSWGEAWGKQGFGFASLAYAEAAFTEAYGVTL